MIGPTNRMTGMLPQIRASANKKFGFIGRIDLTTLIDV
jgi:hypothetical protein